MSTNFSDLKLNLQLGRESPCYGHVDLNESPMASNAEVRELQEVLSSPLAQRVLAHPFCTSPFKKGSERVPEDWQREVSEVAQVVADRRILRCKKRPAPFIKSALPRRAWVAGNEGQVVATSPKDSLLRPIMAQRMRLALQGSSIESFFCIVEEKLCPLLSSDDPCKRYCVISPIEDVMEDKEMMDYFASLSETAQYEIAAKICLFIEKTGYVDAHFGNLRFRKKDQDKIIIFDLEPFGKLFLTEEEKPECSFMDYVIIGLNNFKNKTPFKAVERAVDETIERIKATTQS